MKFRQNAVPIVASLILVWAMVPGALADAANEAAFEQIAEQRSSSLVTVRFVLKVQMGGMFAGMGDQESEQEVGGLMIDPAGLVLVSNTQLGGLASMMRQFAGGMAGDISAVPTDIKVLVGDDTEGVKAELLARDSELDLAWIQISAQPEKPYDHVDTTKSVKPRRGQDLLALWRLGKHFDRVPMVARINVGALTSRPRKLYVANGLSDANGLGVAVFAITGEFVGISVMQLPEVDASDGNPFSMFGALGDVSAGLILPAEQVVRATERAKETAAEGDEEGAAPGAATTSEGADPVE